MLDPQQIEYQYPYAPSETETTYQPTVTLEIHGELALERFLGCMMVAMMPDQGLEEALYSLKDMLVFYNSQPANRGVGRVSELIEGAVIGTTKRPDIVIAPELL